MDYSLEGLPNKVMAAEYRMALPDEELNKTQRALKMQGIMGHFSPKKLGST